MTNYSLTRLHVSQNDSWFHQLPNKCFLNLATYHCQQTFYILFPSTFRSHPHGAFQESITIFSFENPWPNLIPWDIPVGSQVSGIYISIDFPQKNPHPLWRFHHPKEQFFFLKRNIENYTSPDFFSPRKNLGILLLEHNSNPTFFPPKNHPKAEFPSGSTG